MNRFDINTWNIEHITPKSIPYAQWYRLHDVKTFCMLNFSEYQYPHHTILKIHDKYLQHYIYDPNLLFILHEKCSFIMTIYYLCCLDFNDFFCFNRSRYTKFNVLDNFRDLFTTIEQSFIKQYIEFIFGYLF
jgi:hypothetical protein